MQKVQYCISRCRIFMSGSTVCPPPSVILLFLFLQTGEELIDGNHYASHEIEARIETLNTHWQNLSEKWVDEIWLR